MVKAMLRRVLLPLNHPFHCWASLPYVPGMSIMSSYEGIRRPAEGYGYHVDHPFHCWVLRKDCYSRFREKELYPLVSRGFLF